MYRIAAVDDHPMFLEGIACALSEMPDVALVAKGNCASDAIEIANRIRPELMFLDVSVPGCGLQAAQVILAAQVDCRIVFFTSAEDDERLRRSLALGAHGYLLKGDAVSDLQDAIRRVRDGRQFISAEFSRRAADAGRRASANASRIDVLTARERSILNLILTGHSSKEAAAALGVSAATVKSSLSTIYAKLAVRTRLEAVLLWRSWLHEAGTSPAIDCAPRDRRSSEGKGKEPAKTSAMAHASGKTLN